VLACGAALFLTGNLIVRWRLGIGPARLRVLAAAAALATIPVGVYAGLVAQLALVAAVLVAPLVAEPPTAAGQRSARTARAADAGDGAG
jgi:hypothetical protein